MKQKRYVGIEVRALSNMMKRRINSALSAEEECEITRMQAWIIAYLYENQDKDVFQKDIEARFRVRRSTASGILSLMEKYGLIERYAVEYDARLKKLQLTERAVTYHVRVMQSIADTEQQICAEISPEELEAFFRVVDKMKKNLEGPVAAAASRKKQEDASC